MSHAQRHLDNTDREATRRSSSGRDGDRPSQAAAPASVLTTPLSRSRWVQRLLAALLAVSGLATLSYALISVVVVILMAYVPPIPVTETPAALGLRYKNVTFASRGDHVTVRGWLIPGVQPDGRLTVTRTIIVVPGARTNRVDAPAGLLALSGTLARHGFAVLAFDLRGEGASAPAPFSFGYFEQRDVLGAVDFLRKGPLPYPALGRPHAIGGLGLSTGASALLLAAAHEPAIRAVVADSAFADALPIIERELPRRGGLPPLFTPGVLEAARVLYGIDYRAIRPVDAVPHLAPRPVLFIQGAADSFNPPSDARQLYAAASAPPQAHAQLWLVPGADHTQAFHAQPTEYVTRVVSVFAAALGPDTP
jgi:dipeptidyl aminopeptidase/acylaminoacyl peptidase